jgi:signal transduction histidine kinase/ActR/RegA family two-component response regulator
VTSPTGHDERVLVLTPTGRDASLAMTVLTQAGVSVETCDGIEPLARKLEAGAAAAVIAEEALVLPETWVLIDVVQRQPPWSDVPLVVLTSGGEPTGTGLGALRLVEEMGNVTLLERPVRVVTFLSAVRSALRARRRQYEVRDHLEARRRSEGEREMLLARERAARAEVEAANRAKDEFLAVLSHELRTPLQPILGWVKLLRQGGVDEETVQRGHQTIERNARAQAQIVEDLLDVSRVIAGELRLELRPVQLAPVIEAAVDAVHDAAADKSIRIDTVLGPGSVAVCGDRRRLQQVVWNLVSNAVTFTPNGGRATIHLDRVATDAVITVTDTGRGISPHFLPHLFERFRQADSTSTRRHGGLGLGLAIVRHLVESHGGTVRAESVGEGGGATFTVTLPALPEGAELEGEVPGPAVVTDPVLSGFRVLVVDDDAETCELLTTVLGYYGAHVTSAPSADDALSAIERRPPDVVVSDIARRGVDGYSLVRRLRALEAERGWRIPTLALSEHALASDGEQALLAGFQAYAAKPVEPAELAQLIARLARPSEADARH